MSCDGSWGTTPSHRAIVYHTAALTGLRRAELQCLQWGDVHLDDDPPCITLRARTTKSKRSDTLPVNTELADALRGVRPDGWRAIGRMFVAVPTPRTFYADLERAGVDRLTDGTEFDTAGLDLHGLRRTFNTMLATSGVNVRTAMQCMRHTDAKLTTRVYTDPRLLDTHRGVEGLPRLRPGEQNRRRKMTGKYDTGQSLSRTFKPPDPSGIRVSIGFHDSTPALTCPNMTALESRF